MAGKYDYNVIETLPFLGMPMVNAFTAFTDVIIPTTAGLFAVVGIIQLNDTVKANIPRITPPC